jgi:hypothetical protein
VPEPVTPTLVVIGGPRKGAAYPVEMSAADAWRAAVRGSVEVEVVHLEGLVRRDAKWADALRRLSVSLQELRERFSGDEGIVVDGFSAPHRVSTARWATSDPATRLVVYFSYQQRDAPAGLRGTIHPPDVLGRAFPAT